MKPLDLKAGLCLAQGRVAAVAWLGSACERVGPPCRCLDMVLRTAVFCASDKSNEVRKAGEAMMASVIEVCSLTPSFPKCAAAMS